MFSSRKTGSASNAYNLTNSLRFRSSASAYLNRTPASAGDRQKWTWSGWVKLGLLSPSSGWNAIFGAYSNDSNRTFFYTNNNSVSNTFYIFDVAGGSTTCNLISTQVLRDVSAWYHLIVSVDTTQATSSNRIKVYLNGSQITSFGTASYPSQNANLMVNNNVVHYIGASSFSGINLFHDGYMTEINFIDGQALTPSSFGSTSSTTGVWQPIKYTGTYGTNGFYLPFTDNSALTTSSNVGLGKDFSGNANYWTTNNISITSGSTYDSMTDVPTLTSATTANYATLNPLNPTGGTYSDGNLKWVSATTDGRFALSTFDITSTGKWYCEVTIGTKSGTYWTVGAFGNSTTFNPRMQYRSDGATQVDGSAGSTWSSFTTGDVIGMAFDSSTNQITFYKNGTSQGTLTASTTGVSYYFGCGSDSSGSTSTYTINFGQQPFAQSVPSTYKALNTYNLPTPTIGATASTQANKYMDATLYTGTGTTAQNIVNAGSFAPDFVWIKSRSGAYYNELFDIIRGVNKPLFSNDTLAEANRTGMTAFNSNGFTVQDNGTTNQGTNAPGATFVGWQWKANGSGSSNTNGSITSTVSANTSAGFSIVTYTGSGAAATVGHGLGVAPSMIIIKDRDNGGYDWNVYHASLSSPTTLKLYLNTTDAENNGGTNSGTWNSTAPTSTVFSLGTFLNVNKSGDKFVAYCFAPIVGYSAFGSYTGNGSTDGPFVYTGFRPKFVMVKCSSSSQGGNADWRMYDTSRDPYNIVSNVLYANLSNAEGSAPDMCDIVSNGFKIKNTSSGQNANGATYIFVAFAESPFKYANAR
jgi:hypothetical protein